MIGTYRGVPVWRAGAGSNASNNTKQVIVVHDTEGSFEGAISWMVSQQNGSYQIIRALAGQGVRMVTDSRQAWAAMSTGNRIGLHVCLEGYASWTRATWLAKGADGLEGVAHDIAEWSRLYNIPLQRVSAAQIRSGVKGVCTHADISAAYKESDHTDPGTGFPLDLVLARANELTDLYGPDTKAQLTGSASLGKYPGWPQLGNRTVTDAVAAILERLSNG